MKQKTLLILISYLTIYIVWGSTYFFIKMAVATIPPFYVVGLRWLIGGLLFLIFTAFTGKLRSFPGWKVISASTFLGIFLLIGGNGLITLSERQVDSYLVALLLAATPIVVAFFDWIFLGKKLSLMALVGITFGVVGVGFLLYNGQSLLSSFTPAIITAIGGLVFWSFATSLGHKVKAHPDVVVNSGIQMIIVGIICIAWLYINGQSLETALHSVSPQSTFGLWYLAIVGSLAFMAYNYLIANEPAIRIVSYAFVNPLIAVLLGLVFGHEKPVPFLLTGLPMILFGLFLMLYGEPLIGYFRKGYGKTK